MKDGTQGDTDEQQDYDVGHAGQLGQPIGHKRQNQQSRRQAEDVCHIHEKNLKPSISWANKPANRRQWKQTSYMERIEFR